VSSTGLDVAAPAAGLGASGLDEPLEAFGIALHLTTRFDLKYGAGGLPHETLMTNIELYGRQVIPRVRDLMKE
jgi:hypothetical protein